ncbi:MAG: hypothetical protein HY852_23115 [Bradyrhizobium sp.]|uniref:hypothetical protein n=1 Tax=Bradyrhizobium sp. TaxID=376 RepID=UPI0025B7F458|nr:hypothetical protein [Bradyrhizobium sp.]MBI5264696.1 hypothetical protein [Bradyrhizobium sp.]
MTVEAVAPGSDPVADVDGSGWIAAIRAGDFERAWKIADADLARLRMSNPPKHEGPRHLQRIWRGEEIRDQRVLVRCYHGLGDTIQFIRFMTPLRKIARVVTVWCQPELLSLVNRVEGVDRAIPLHDGAPEVDFDVDIEIMEVPHAIRAGLREVELKNPFLDVPATCDAAPVLSTPGRLALGMVWEVGDWDRRRSIPPTLFRNLLVEGAQLYSLQRGAGSAAASKIGAIDISTPDIMSLARRMQGLDLVLSVDTMVAHLAGSLGIETWIMLHSDCDWRWPAVGDRSMWYASARLFRQRTAGDWTPVVRAIGSALRERLHRSEASRAIRR